jgi:hypothetical protein
LNSVGLNSCEVEHLPQNFTPGAGNADGPQFPNENQGWLSTSRDEQSPAALVRATSSPRSAFLVYLKSPPGSNTARYIATLRQFSRMCTEQHCDEHAWNVPQFPLGKNLR